MSFPPQRHGAPQGSPQPHQFARPGPEGSVNLRGFRIYQWWMGVYVALCPLGCAVYFLIHYYGDRLQRGELTFGSPASVVFLVLVLCMGLHLNRVDHELHLPWQTALVPSGRTKWGVSAPRPVLLVRLPKRGSVKLVTLLRAARGDLFVHDPHGRW